MLLVLDGSLIEAHDGPSHEFLRKLTGLRSVVETFARFVGAKVGQRVLPWFLT